MGEAIMAQAILSEDLEVVAAVEHAEHPHLGEHVVARAPALTADLAHAISAAAPVDVVVDFSHHTSTVPAAEICRQHNVAFVTGTTGLQLDEQRRLEACATDIPIIAAPNMSVGVNLLLGLIDQATRALGEDWDAEVFEIHHRHKRDAPSGTAMALAQQIATSRNRDPEHTLQLVRSGREALREDHEVGLAALRGGDVVGEHTVFFFGDGERIELTHRATNRLIFVHGVLRAIRWVSGRTAGLYTMQDVLFR